MSQPCLNAAPMDFEDLGPATLPWTSSFRLRARHIDQDFLIEVARPPVRPKPGETFPVVYVLDGNQTFGLVAMAARALQSGPFPLPPTLVVGIGYHFRRPQDRVQAGTLRMRDLTPCPDDLLESQYPGASARCGGAAAFHAFIEEEVKPFVASGFPVDPRDQTLVGTSLGGLFALNTLFTAPASFQRYVAISPALYWGSRHLFDLEAALATRTNDLSAHLFLAAGSLEEAHDARQAFVSNCYAMEAQLRSRAYPSLDLALRVFEGETHMSVYPGAVTRGLGEVFGGYNDMSDWSRWLQVASA
jgi:predicted alpha/beta superfamily hydrolase